MNRDDAFDLGLKFLAVSVVILFWHVLSWGIDRALADEQGFSPDCTTDIARVLNEQEHYARELERLAEDAFALKEEEMFFELVGLADYIRANLPSECIPND